MRVVCHVGTEKKMHENPPSRGVQHAIELTPQCQVLLSTSFALENATPELTYLSLQAQLRLEKPVVDLSKCFVPFLTLHHLHLALLLPFVGD